MDIGYALLLSLASHHSERDGQNEFNPGVGLAVQSTTYVNNNPFVSYLAAGTYRDSFDNSNKMVMTGIEYPYYADDSILVGFGFSKSFKYENDRDNDIKISLTVGKRLTDKFTVYFVYTTEVYGAGLKYTFF